MPTTERKPPNCSFRSSGISLGSWFLVDFPRHDDLSQRDRHQWNQDGCSHWHGRLTHDWAEDRQQQEYRRIRATFQGPIKNSVSSSSPWALALMINDVECVGADTNAYREGEPLRSDSFIRSPRQRDTHDFLIVPRENVLIGVRWMCPSHAIAAS